MRERAHLAHSTVRGNTGTYAEGRGGGAKNDSQRIQPALVIWTLEDGKDKVSDTALLRKA